VRRSVTNLEAGLESNIVAGLPDSLGPRTGRQLGDRSRRGRIVAADLLAVLDRRRQDLEGIALDQPHGVARQPTR
jgi:hypothetical protein